MKMLLRAFILLIAGAALAASPAEAQIWKKVKKAAKQSAERTVERKTAEKTEEVVGSAVDAAVDPAIGAVVCALGDEACIEEAKREGRAVEVTDENGNVVRQIPGEGASENAGQPSATSAEAASMAPGEGAWANYDFVPGDRVLFAEDFESEYVGNVPGRIDFHSGVMEVVQQGDEQMLRFSDAGAFAIPLPETLPEQFTVEFDLYSADDWNSLILGTGPLDHEDRGYHCFQGNLNNHSAAEFKIGSSFQTGVVSEKGGTSQTSQSAHEKAMVPVRVAVDGQYVKMYIGEQRVANVPNADVQRTDRLLVTACGELAAEDDGRRGPILLDNVRIAAGGRAILYDKLQAEGKVVTHGILFDTGSASLRPESTPTLEDIGRMLEQHPDLRIKIEGHTDNVGSAETNKALSQQRAEAVKLYLEEKHGVDAGRLEAVGMGQEQPVASNDTPEGKQSNRRVELVRL